jgi:ABC-type nitrate/sulfonate/bicarbonate transport system substrate-binding protein
MKGAQMSKLVAAMCALFVGAPLLSPQVWAQDTIKVGYAIQAHQANMMVLPKFAEKYGLKVDLVAMRRFPDLQLALTTHQVDAAVLGYVNIALMEENDIKNYKIVSGVYVAPGSLVLGPDVADKVKTWKDLEGTSLGTAPNGAVDIVFRAILKQHNVDQNKIKMVSFGALGPPLQTALKDHDIDGFIAWERNNADAVVATLGVYSQLDIGDNPSKGVQAYLWSTRLLPQRTIRSRATWCALWWMRPIISTIIRKSGRMLPSRERDHRSRCSRSPCRMGVSTQTSTRTKVKRCWI